MAKNDRMIFNKNITLTSILLLWGTFLFSQGITVQAVLDKNQILIGDQIYFTIKARIPAGAKITLPVFKDSIASKIEIVETPKTDTVKKAGLYEINQRYLITSFDSGNHVIPSLKIPLFINGVNDTMHTQDILLFVSSIPIKSKEVFDIKPPFDAPFYIWEVLKWVLLGLLIIAIIIFAIIYFKKRRRGEKIFSIRKVKEPAHVIALRELDKLKSEKIWQQGKAKIFHTRLTDILRQYIEARFNILAMEQTTDEILTDLQKTDFSEKTLFSSLKILLQTADMVKFAKSEPLPEENDSCLAMGYDFVQKSKIVETLINEPIEQPIHPKEELSNDKLIER